MQFNSSSETKVNTFNERNKKMHSSSETKKTFIERNKKIHSSSETKKKYIHRAKQKNPFIDETKIEKKRAHTRTRFARSKFLENHDFAPMQFNSFD